MIAEWLAAGAVCDYLLNVRNALDSAIAPGLGRSSILALVLDIINLGTACFQEYGIAQRDLNQPIVNERDGQPV